MEKEYYLSGKGISPEEEKKARNTVDESRKKAAEPVEEELEKSEEEKRMIERINSYLSQELEELGIPKKAPFSPDCYHFFSNEKFQDMFPKQKGAAIHHPLANAVFLNRDQFSRLGLFKALFHETVHLASHSKYNIDNESKKIKQYRLGYGMVDPNRSELHSRLQGFLEGVTDKMTLEIARKHKNDFFAEFNISPEEQKEILKFYANYMEIIDVIIEKVAKAKNEEKGAVWTRIKKGLFTGEMAHLRDIERAFGKGSLRVLSVMGSSGARDLPQGEINDMIMEYFSSDSEEKRDGIAKSILEEKEIEEYAARRK